MNSGVAEASPKYLADVATNGIPVGYKQTEVGIIPEDWETKPLGELVEIYSGDSPSKFVFSTEGTPYFKVEQLNNGSVYADTTPYFIHSSKKVLAGSVIFPKRGASILSNKIRVLKYDSFMDTNLMALTCHHGLDELFLYNQLTYRGLDSVADTTSIPQINNKHISPYLVPLPRKAEQTAIANALSDVDALISELKKLIAKKQAIKTATMQQLLTGRTRLPQFALRADGTPKGTKPSELGEIPEDWERISIGRDTVLKARIGWQALTTKEYQTTGDIYLVTGTDFDSGAVKWERCFYVSEWRYKQDQNIQLRNDDVLITKDGTIGKVGYVTALSRPATLNSGVFVVRPKNNNLMQRFLFYVLTSRVFDDFINRITAGSTITHLYQKDFVNFEFSAPCIEEQTAIATILSDMDEEIQALEQRLGKTRQIKQGMMQELLTGKTRLLQPLNKESQHG
ncbi:restriction endonuclease subunit S [Vibrio cholerae]